MIIWVTGQMAAGKNAVAEILQEEGWPCLDADKTGHQALANCQAKVLETFLPIANRMSLPLQNQDGSINRKILGQIVFSDPCLLELHESIIYPEILRLINKFIEENHRNCVINGAVLYKIPQLTSPNLVLFVQAPYFQRLRRAVTRDKAPKKLIKQRFKSQKNLFAKYQFSNADIRRVRNAGSREALKAKIRKILDSLAR